MAQFTEKQQLAILKIAQDIVWKDGEFTEEELGTILQKEHKWGIDTFEKFKEMWDQTSALSFLRAAAIIEEFDEQQKRIASAFFLSLVADNGIEAEEQTLYETVRDACRLPALSLSEAIEIDEADNGAGQIRRISFNGGYYEGETKNGLYHGKGRMVWDNGQSFEGVFENGKRVEGTYSWPNGEKYTGHFRDGKRNGFGKYFYANGDIYEGLWLDGLKHGFGIYRYCSGSYDLGEYRHDKQDGYVVWVNDDKKTYKARHYSEGTLTDERVYTLE
ncbi:MAG: MORN repeat-containing protein [Candidatus Cryptobacteroides sp.]